MSVINSNGDILDEPSEYILGSEDEIRAIINTLEDKSIPSVMKHFKANYQGQVDNSLVSKIAREMN